MRVCLIGCVEFSKHALQKLLELEAQNMCEVVGVITKQSSPSNSDFVDLGASFMPTDELRNRLHYYSSEEKILEFLTHVQPDVIYCFGWSSLLGISILQAAPKGVIGFHPAELPKNRGRHPIIWALAMGLPETASTFFRMNEGADSGPILSQEQVSIEESDDARSLYDKIVGVAMKQIAEFTDELSENREALRKQDRTLANYWRKRSAKDGLIDWRMTAQDIHNLVRALTIPYPGAQFLSKDDDLITVWQSAVAPDLAPLNLEPGKVLNVQNSKILVKCAQDSSLWLNLTEPALDVNVGDYL